MKPIRITDSELLQKTSLAAKDEKMATLTLLRYLVQVDERRAYATLACSSLFEYVVKVLGYSETQASERVNSVRLMRAIPVVEKQIESGSLSMTTASQVQRFLRQEKKVGNELGHADSLKVIETCAGQSKREVEKTLFALSSDEAKIESAERIRELSVEHTELKFAVTEQTYQKLNELKNLMGNESLQNIFDLAIDALLVQVKKKKGVVDSGVKVNQPSHSGESTFPGKSRMPDLRDNLKSPTQVVAKPTLPGKFVTSHSRYISIHVKRHISQRSGNQCEYVDEETGKRCQSKFRLEFDHYPVPYSRGGRNDAASLRHACFQHNQKFAMDSGSQ